LGSKGEASKGAERAEVKSGETLRQKQGVQKKLKEELEQLDRILGLGLNLKVMWIPCVEKNLLGEVKGGNILIYEEDEDEALNVLRHEVVDYCISQAIEPYKEVLNMFIKMKNEDAYRRKEKIVEALTRLLTGKAEDEHR